MAFQGVAVIKQVADNLVRITGVSLDTAAPNGETGTIGLFESTAVAPDPDVRLPDGFNAGPYSRPGASDVSLVDAIEVTVTSLDGGAVKVPVNIGKAGLTREAFLITLTAVEAGVESPVDTGDLEIYVRFH